MPHRYCREKHVRNGASPQLFDKSTELADEWTSEDVEVPAELQCDASRKVETKSILRGLPSPARSRANTSRKSQQHPQSVSNGDDAASDALFSASAKNYRELLQARGNEVIRSNRRAQKIKAAKKPAARSHLEDQHDGNDQADMLAHRENSSPPTPGKNRGTTPPCSPMSLVSTCYPESSPCTPSLESALGHSPFTPTMIPHLSPHGVLNSPSFMMPGMWPLPSLPSSSPSPTPSTVQCDVYDHDQLMSTLLPNGHGMSANELATRLLAAAPCCYED